MVIVRDPVTRAVSDLTQIYTKYNKDLQNTMNYKNGTVKSNNSILNPGFYAR